MLTVLAHTRTFRSTRGKRVQSRNQMAQQLQSMAAKNPKFGLFTWEAREKRKGPFVARVKANTRSEAHAKVRRILLHKVYILVRVNAKAKQTQASRS